MWLGLDSRVGAAARKVVACVEVAGVFCSASGMPQARAYGAEATRLHSVW